MAEPTPGEAFRSHWLAFPVAMFLTDRTPERPRVAIEVRTGDEPVTIETVAGGVQTRPGAAENPDLVLTGAPQLVVGVLAGVLEPDEARERGLRYEGDPRVLRRLRPKAPRQPSGAAR
jgi:hypothetical protein